MPDLTLLTARDFIGVRAGLVAALGNDANAALVLTRISYRTEGGWHESHVDDAGRWWWRAGYEVIADETGLTRDQVKRALRTLSNEGWIDSQTFRREGPYDRTLSYSVVVPDDRADSPDERAGSPDVDRADSPDVPLTRPVKKITTADGPKTEAEVDRVFGIFWAAYPRHIARAKARQSFEKAIAKVSASVIVEAAGRYRRHVGDSDPKFIAHPATWLNQERWDDELGPVAGTGRDSIRSL